MPIGLSVPHAGLIVPEDLAGQCVLSPEQIEADGDVGAAEIYDLVGEVAEYVISEVARAVLDLNRAEDDLRKDGIVKTHTCWDEPVWRELLRQDQIDTLLDRHWRPYHGRLRTWCGKVKLAVDCHTMAAVGPPVGPDSGQSRPLVCLGDAQGRSCPGEWVDSLRVCFAKQFGEDEVTVNEPFSGGFITRSHGGLQPWVQLELSRCEERWSRAGKRKAVLTALTEWCREWA